MYFVFILIAVITLTILIYYKIIKPAKYWEERDVVHAKSFPLVGSLKDFVFRKKHICEITSDIYNQFPKERCVGYMHFTKPFLLLRDLELIKQVAVKDFDHFHDHLALTNAQSDPLLSKSLISLNGEDWRQMRATLSPAFTSSKMKSMYQLMDECAKNFANHFRSVAALDMKEIFSKFANDVIATTAFGVKIDSMEDPTNEFFIMGQTFTKLGFLQTVKMFVMQLAPALSNMLRIQVFDKNVGSFFRNTVKDNIDKRENEGIIRPDLIHLLMEARKGRLTHDKEVEEESPLRSNQQMELTDDLIVSQALTFFFAGFDTVSTAACFMAYELAVNPDAQKKLQIEIDTMNTKFKDHLPYEALQSMKYLDQVVCETLRLWPPGFQTDRLCVKDYVIEPKLPKEKVVFVEKGTAILVPIMALHRDPQYYQEPQRFDPERFNDENRPNIVPGTYLPFGLGPRNCIGSRFALLEIKTLFFHLLSKFIIVPVDETEIPLKISPKHLNMAPENGFKLGFRHRPIPSY